MRYLEITSLNVLNGLFSDLGCSDSTRIVARAEAYSCKVTRDDRFLQNSLPAEVSSRKLYMQLVGCLNSAFPDYDFNVGESSFERNECVEGVIELINSSLFSSGVVATDSQSLVQLIQTLWSCIDDAIEVAECTVFSFRSSNGAIDAFNDGNPAVWLLNFLFHNKKRKRVLLLTMRREMRGSGTGNLGSDDQAPDSRSGSPFVVLRSIEEIESDVSE